MILSPPSETCLGKWAEAFGANPAVARMADAAMASIALRAHGVGGYTPVNRLTVPWHFAVNMAIGWWVGSRGTRSAWLAAHALAKSLRESTGWNRCSKVWRSRTRMYS